MITALSFTSTVVQADDAWVLRALVVDADGTPSADVPTVTITEAGAAEVGPFDMDSTVCPGVFRLVHYPGLPGRAVATATHASHGVVSWVADVRRVVTAAGMPTVTTCNNYIGDHSWSDADVQDALDTEMAAQFAVCRIPAAYPADLRAAVHRRVQRNLSLRSLPLAVRESADGESQMIVPGRDPEVRRLEGPYRKVSIG